MAERTYNDDNFQGKTKKSVKRQIPKNLRQIGKIGDGLKIYVEDYVKTYVKQLGEFEEDGNNAAVLVGEYVRDNNERSIFIYGAIHLDDVWQDGELRFTEDTWTSVYEKMKQYFPEGEIAGWYVGKSEWTDMHYDMLKSVHLDNFAGRDKLLLHYDIMEKDGEFYCYEGGELRLQSGYFIYYDKNEEMQDYMIDHKQIKREEQYVEDRAVKEFRNIFQEKHPNGQKVSQNANVKLMYASGIVIVMVVFVIGITAMNNNEKMKGIEEAIQTISDSLTGEGKENKSTAAPTKEAGNIFEIIPATENSENPDELTIETSSDNQVTPLPTDTQIKEAEATPEPTKIAEETKAPEPTKTAEVTKAPEPTPTVAPTEKPTTTEQENNTKEQEKTTQPVYTSEQLTIYKVQPGDTLAGICIRLYGSINSMKTIQELNQILDENKIYAGQELAVPKQ